MGCGKTLETRPHHQQKKNKSLCQVDFFSSKVRKLEVKSTLT
jgi:hypothetical protein